MRFYGCAFIAFMMLVARRFREVCILFASPANEPSGMNYIISLRCEALKIEKFFLNVLLSITDLGYGVEVPTLT